LPGGFAIVLYYIKPIHTQCITHFMGYFLRQGHDSGGFLWGKAVDIFYMAVWDYKHMAFAAWVPVHYGNAISVFIDFVCRYAAFCY